MKKKKDESSSTEIIEPTCATTKSTCTQKRRLSRLKRDEMHLQSKKKT